jgi:DNA-binding transcriptional MocR family regulator
MRSLYRMRHDELIAQLKPFGSRFRILGSGAGLHLVLEAMPETVRELRAFCDPGEEDSRGIEQILRQKALGQGVCVYCLSDYRITFYDRGTLVKDRSTDTDDETDREKPGLHRPALLLGFGALDEEQIMEVARRLSLAWSIQ